MSCQFVILVTLIGCGNNPDKDKNASKFDGSQYLTSFVRDAEAAIDGASDALKATLNEAPSEYTFINTETGKNSVSYPGQTFRQVLIENLKANIDGLTQAGSSVSKAQLLEVLESYYKYSGANASTVDGAIKGNSLHGVSSQSTTGESIPILQGATYDDLQKNGKQLQDKIAGVDNSLRYASLFGYSDIETPDALISTWLGAIAEAAVNGSAYTVKNGALDDQTISKAYVTKDGLDLNQLVQKFLHGAVSFSQAAEDYLSNDLGEGKGLNADNSSLVDSKDYTALEHHWDEGFGYYGAARNYLSYSDEQIAEGHSIDTNGDGKIDVLTEKNFGLSLNAAKRDRGAKAGDVDLTKSTMEGFLRGRHLLAKKPEGYKDLLPSIAIVTLYCWEKTFVSSLIHYINKTISNMKAYGTENYSFTNHAKHWSEMKGFAMAMQFNPKSALSIDGFKKLHELIGDKPVLGSAEEDEISQYQYKIKDARKLLQDVYGFSQDTVENW